MKCRNTLLLQEVWVSLSPVGTEEFNMTTIYGTNTFETNGIRSLDGCRCIDADDVVIHRWILGSYHTQGIDIRTDLEDGTHRLALVNGGKSGSFW